MINVLELEPGARVLMKGEITAEVVSNPRDGSWIRVRYVNHPEEPDMVGTEELVFAEEVLDLA